MKKNKSHSISNFINDELSTVEKKQFNESLKENEYRNNFKETIIANHIADLNAKRYDSNKAFDKFIAEVDSDQTKKEGLFFKLQEYYKYAAIIVITLTIGAYFVFSGGSASNIVRVEVPNNQKRELILPDGTNVLINAGSVLSYNKDFFDRVVKIDGEAYFEVPKIEGKNFIVQLSDNTKVKVLGTKFGVKAYKDDLRIETALLEGKIELSSAIISKETPLVILPNTTVIIDKKNKTLQLLVDDKHAKNAVSWLNDEFIFHNEYLNDIINNLNRVYNVKIVIGSSILGAEYYTASFNKGTKLESILEDLSISGNFKVNKIDRTHFNIYSN